MELFTPLGDLKGYCWIFRTLCIIQFISAVMLACVLIWTIYKAKYNTGIRVLFGLFGSIMYYFINRVFYTMCVHAA